MKKGQKNRTFVDSRTGRHLSGAEIQEYQNQLKKQARLEAAHAEARENLKAMKGIEYVGESHPEGNPMRTALTCEIKGMEDSRIHICGVKGLEWPEIFKSKLSEAEMKIITELHRKAFNDVLKEHNDTKNAAMAPLFEEIKEFAQVRDLENSVAEDDEEEVSSQVPEAQAS